MKKKIAVFAAGWGSEILKQYLDGFMEGLNGTKTDAFLFLCYPLLNYDQSDIHGELNIFNLPDLSDFDGALIFGNSLDFNDIFDIVVNKCQDAGIPTACCGRIPSYGSFIAPDNYTGMKDLCIHLRDHHDVKTVVFLAGSDNNPDSNTRWEATKKIFNELGGSRVFYTNWDISKVEGIVDTVINSPESLPDAFLCANDGLANFCIDALKNRNINVPNDVIVTGFDDTFYSSLFDPSLTTVSQNFQAIGSKCAEVLLKAFEGKEVEEKFIVPCIFLNRESCGCEDTAQGNAFRRKICRNIYIERLNQNNFDNALNHLDSLLITGKRASDITKLLSEHYCHSCSFEKGNIHVILENSYQDVSDLDNVQLPFSGYSSVMNDVFSLTDGVVSNNPDFEIRELVPGYDPEDEENHAFIFLPLHDKSKTMGYFVLKDVLNQIDNNDNLVRYEQRLSSIFTKFRLNLYTNYLNSKLMEINETDPLTNVKNRQAYINRTEQINELIAQKKMKEFAVAVFDINNLKIINDNLGHEAGDEYICNCCNFLCGIFKKSPVFRIGGDEFAILLQNKDYKDRDYLFMILENRMKEISEKETMISNRVSVAYGCSKYIPSDTDISMVFNRADELMYQKKKEMKS